MSLPSVIDEIRLNSINSGATFVIVSEECGTLVSEHQALSEVIHAVRAFAKGRTEQSSIYYRLASGWLKLWSGPFCDSPPLELNTPS